MPDDEDAELEEREKEEEEGRLGPRRRSRDWTSRSKARDDVDVVVMVAVGFVLVLRPGGGPAKPDSAMFSRKKQTKSKPKARQKKTKPVLLAVRGFVHDAVSIHTSVVQKRKVVSAALRTNQSRLCGQKRGCTESILCLRCKTQT